MTRRKPKLKRHTHFGIHEQGVDDLAQRLIKSGNYNHVLCNVFYTKGECDVLTIDDNKYVYWEFKCNDTWKGRNKAKNQLQRWSNYMSTYDKSKDYYGIYYTPTTMKIVCKNGRLR